MVGGVIYTPPHRSRVKKRFMIYDFYFNTKFVYRYTNFINVTVSAETKAHVPVSSPVPVSESAHNKNGKSGHSNGHDGQTNVSMDSGVLLSPSPPTDSGIVLMSPHVASKFNNNNNTNSKLLASNQQINKLLASNQQSLDQHEDSVSVLSCSLSEGSEASSSRQYVKKILKKE